jgi:hypothetical protein
MRLLLAAFLTAAWSISYPLAAQETQIRLPKPAPAACVCIATDDSCAGRLVASTANFRIQWSASADELRALAETCETQLAQSKASWLGTAKSSVWVPQCEIVVHGDSAAYVACLGPHSAQTSGCATIRIEQGHVVLRRIDLAADALDWRTESLPHELTHVVLADRFSTRRISPWADEGIAMLAETAAKRNRRLTAVHASLESGATYTVRDLMNVHTFPEPALRNAFYGQSVALVRQLLNWGTRKQLLDFVEASQSQGPDAALAAVYGNRAIAELDRQLADGLSSDRFVELAGATTTPAILRK